MIYGGGYDGYSTQAGTWTQTFTTSDGVVSATCSGRSTSSKWRL